MKWQQFFRELDSEEAYLQILEADLVYDGPSEWLTPDRLAFLKENKSELIQFLGSDVTTHPLSYGQRALWFEQQLVPTTSAYNLSVAVQLCSVPDSSRPDSSYLDIEALRLAFQHLLCRHASLRSTFANEDGAPTLLIHRFQAVQLNVIDATGWTDEYLHEQVTAAHQQPFDLAQGPLWRINLWKRSENEHVLCWTIHHLIADGWSCWMALDELRLLYAAALDEEYLSLPPVKATYRDYVAWQEQMLTEEGEALWSYWSKQLAGELPILNLPTDRPRPAVEAHRGASLPLTLPPQLTDELRLFAKAQGITLYGLLLAAFQLLLHRYTDQDDILVGSPVVARSRAEYAQTFGYFVNPVVLRSQLTDNPTIAEFLEQTRETVRGALQHQAYPFPLLVERMLPERTPNLSPIFQTMFALQQEQTSLRRSRPAGPFAEKLTLAPYDIPQFEGQFDLFLELQNGPGALRGTLKYSTDLFDSATIERMAERFQALLSAMAKSPNLHVDSLSLLTDTEYHQVVNDWNNTAVDFGEPQTVQSLFEQQVQRTPDAVALVFEKEEWTYAELNERANRLAHHILQLASCPDSDQSPKVELNGMVGLSIGRSPEMILGVLGILKSGNAYVPFDPSYPEDRIQFMLQDANVGLLVTTRELKQQLPAHNATIITLEELPTTEAPVSNPSGCGQVDDPAYLLYTSGSTGKPKAVSQHHRTLFNLVAWQQNECKGNGRTLQYAPLNFDVSVQEIFSTLCVGGTLVLVDEETRRDPYALLAHLQEHSVERLFIPFTPLQQLINITDGTADNSVPNSLRAVIQCGEPLRITDPFRHWFNQSQCELYNHYGPTESHVVTTYKLDSDSSKWTELPSIGVPVPNTHLYILNDQLEPTPIGLSGELYIGGVQMAHGYMNRAELTAERFIEHPRFGRLYKTGDLCSWMPDGNIRFIGRADSQVKIRGFRIELEEIEVNLASHPSIKMATVTTWQPTIGDQRLVAYLVPDPLRYPDIHDLRGYLQKRLPEYMVPSAFMLIDEVPMTPNGKVDIRSLPEPTLNHLLQTEFDPPRTLLEELVADVYAEVLGLTRVGRQDDFFALGGHSLLATQALSRLRRIRQVELPVRTLFQAPTVAAMAAVIEGEQMAADVDVPPLGPIEHKSPPQLSFAQERMWFIHQLAPESAAYNISTAYRLQGEIDIPLLKQSFNLLVERHESLRTTFEVVDGKPVQIIQPSLPPRVTVIDLQVLGDAISAKEKEERAQLAINELSREPFDLEAGPLVRGSLIVLDNSTHIIATSIHHIVSDQWSYGILGRELSTIYSALIQNEPVSLEALPVQYADYAVWQRKWLSGDLLEAKLSYWKRALDGITALDLPTDFPRPPLKTFNGRMSRRAISASTLDAIRRFCRQEHVTPYMFFLAIFKSVLMHYSGQHDIAVGSPIANRNWYETETLMGTLVNTVVIRSKVEDNLSFKEFLHAVRDTALDAFHYQDFPFEKLVEELQPPRDLSRSPLFQVFFNVINAPFSPLEVYGTSSPEFVWPETGAAQFDLSLIISTDLFPQMIIEYNTDLYKETTISRLFGHMETLIEGALNDPEQRLVDLPMLTQPERALLLDEWNAAQADYPRDKCVHQLFEEQAQRTPDAIAVIFDDRRLSDSWPLFNSDTSTAHQLPVALTYRELNERANQLAHYLQSRGVGPEQLVAICIDRSLDMMVGLLGILKAGGAYVPLDPNYPRERLAMMLEDAEVTLLLTQDHLQQALVLDAPQIVRIDTDWPQIGQEPICTPGHISTPQNRAYVIFTSGSTGRPKGVQIPHRAFTNFLWTMQTEPGLKPEDIWLSVTTLSFDIAGLELFLPIITGAKVILTPQSSTVDGPLLAQMLENHNVNMMQATPATWRLLLNSGWSGRKSLKILCGGEALSPSLSEKLLGKCAELWNMYGPTETTVWSTIHRVLPTDEQILIGRPIGNTDIYILDEALNPTPAGVPGILYIGGEGVALGYLNRPELTAERFINNPFGEGLIYNTGDLARYKPDGRIECLGRIDSQVKVRGFRIELGEIEANLAKHERVQAAAVSTWAPTEDDKRLVAYIVSSSDEDLDFAELRSHIQNQLPEYMVPNNFMVLDALPLTPNGKVNYKALPEPQRDDTLKRVFVEPETALEEKISAIFAEVLGLDRVGRHDNFFELGGHSLLAVQLFAKIEESLTDQRLPLALLFEAPTAAEIAALIQTDDVEQAWSLVVPLRTQGQKPPLFCIHAAGGNVLLYRELANHLAEYDQPVYGIQAQGLDGKQPILTTVEEMAAAYIQQLRAIRPEGPYLLLGYCLGGTIAFEMAQQLTSQREKVAFVGLLETYNWAQLKAPTFMGTTRHQLQRFEYIARNFLLLSGAERTAFLSGKWERVRGRTSIWQGEASGVLQRKNGESHLIIPATNGANGHNSMSSTSPTTGGSLGDDSTVANDTSLNGRLAQLWKSNDAATLAYRPTQYSGSVTQFVPMKDYAGFSDPDLGWGDIALGGVTVEKLPVYPAGMIHNPFAEKLAERVARQVERNLSWLTSQIMAGDAMN